MKELPRRKDKGDTITTNYPLPLAPNMKAELRSLQAKFDVNEWLRAHIRKELPKIRRKFESA